MTNSGAIGAVCSTPVGSSPVSSLSDGGSSSTYMHFDVQVFISWNISILMFRCGRWSKKHHVDS